MKPDNEPNELIEMLESGYAAPPLDDAFSSNLVRRLQAEVVPQAIVPRRRQVRWAVVLSGFTIAASILAVLWIANPLGRNPSRDIAMQSVTSSNDALISWFESSLSLESTQSRPRQAGDFEVSDSKASDAIPLNERSDELVRPAGNANSRPPSSRFYLDDERKRSEFEHESEIEPLENVASAGVAQEREANIGLSQSLSLESLSGATMEEIEIVSRERAKELGLSITSEAAGPDAVRIELEFEKQGELKEDVRVTLEQFDGDKLLLSVPLKEGEAKPGRIVVGFVTARSNLERLFLKVAARDASGSRVGYVLPMKDFVDLKDIR